MTATENTRRNIATRRFHALDLTLIALAVVAGLSGLALLPYYQADPGAAYASVQAIRQEPLLRFVQAAHHWASALLLVLGAFCLIYGLLSAAYRRPGHILWVATVSLVLVCLLLQLTGHLLPWDTRAVRTAVIETAIARQAPVLGPAQARLLRGGEEVGPATLSLWYRAHVALLPLVLLALLGTMLAAVRSGRRPSARASISITAALGVLLVTALFLKPPLEAAATAADYRSFAAPPEWYVLPLHSLLKLAQSVNPDLAFIGTMVLPALVVGLLFGLPWLDRRRVQEPPSHRVRGLAALGVLCMAALVAMSEPEAAPVVGGMSAPVSQAAMADPAPIGPIDPALVARGQTLFHSNGCIGCHQVQGKGGETGPALDGEAARHSDLAWQIAHLKKPDSMTPGSTMPAYGRLSDTDLRALATYLLNLK